MRCAFSFLILPLILAACGINQEAKGPAQTTVTSGDAAVAKESPREIAPRAEERDACSMYADCIDQGPAPDPNEGAMHASSATIRSWDRTTEQLRQCSVAHDLARAGGICH